MDAAEPQLSREEIFEQAHVKMAERIEQYQERVLEVLRGHLGAEQALNELLRVARRRRKRRTFAGKMDVAKGLFVKEMTEELWALLKVGNELRNALAHGHKQGTVENKIVELRKAFIAASTTEQKKYIEGMTERQMITMAFSHCACHLIAAADRLERQG
ncbi:hypothetical protein [Bradyrhizobium sp. WSM2793]|uniref:hypothetical protein n=1 Tax=Bradyrhizobium sp. WSM2793 TaxID=1038866 RepID=UPI000364E857|nr:hypothetical protein [Bradyrhizobium sp. WSM2793]